jgi:exodeoxyribonuclease VII large subunit
MILQFNTIKEIVKTQPKTSDELLRIKGMGPVKVRKYGDDILKIVRGEGIVGNDSGELKIKDYEVGGGNLFEEAESINELAGSGKIPAYAGMTNGARMTRGAGMTKDAEVVGGEDMKIDQTTGEIIEDKCDDAVTVTEFVTMLDTMLRTNFRNIKVQGEIVGFKRNPNGHAYFEIKDRESVLRVAVFKNSYELSGIDLEDGMEVIVTGYPNYHKQYGFSFIGQTVELFGEGALKKAYDKLKKKLEDEGLFAEDRKRVLPQLPKRIGLITSRGGAAIGDFTTNVGSYGYKIIFYHSSVEGAGALGDLQEALKEMARKDLDVLVIVRGGGSLESLQAFNNEKIVRMIADFPVPVVAGVGHEQDETITTLVADVGVSTPTAAAHAVRESWDRVDKFLNTSQQYIMHTFEKGIVNKKTKLLEQEHFIKNVFNQILQDAKNLFERFNNSVKKIDFEITTQKNKLQNNLGQLSYALDKIVIGYNNKIQKATNVLLNFQSTIDMRGRQLVFLEKTLQNNNPKRQLQRGYSITTDKSGKIIRSVKQIKKGDNINVQVNDGSVDATVS